MDPRLESAGVDYLWQAIRHNPDLFGERLGKSLYIDPSRHTVNGENITILGCGTSGIVYKIYHEEQWKALKINRKLWGGKINNTAQNGDHIVFEAFKDEDLKLLAFLRIYHSSLGGEVLLSELCEDGDWRRKRLDDIILLKKNLFPILSSLKTLHARNIVHRDIKPPNLLVKEGGKIVIADFSLAGKCAPDGSGKCGYATSAYRAPEAFLDKDGEKNLKLCDCWSLGITLCEKILGLGEEQKFDCGLYGKFSKQCLGNVITTELGLYIASEAIVDNPKMWKKFISGELKKVVPPVGQLLETTIMSLLNPDRKKALSIDGILTELNRLSNENDANRAEYARLCANNIEYAREPWQKREQEEGRRQDREEDTRAVSSDGTPQWTGTNPPRNSPEGRRERFPATAFDGARTTAVFKRKEQISQPSGKGRP
ncbi:MAG: protein kinase [Rickettsiales bacterium]|jgi:serine/threonine protein kinase|nr:protein kinase [Rickettsiales bacterium]